ncbi:MAG: type II secretion system F family protein [Acidimicrobiales bacterium]
MRIVLIAFLATWAGFALALSEFGWFRRRSLADRLSPYLAGRPPATTSRSSAAGLRDLLEPLSRGMGDGLARAFGVAEDVESRLRRIHSDTTGGEFRVQQLGWAVTAMAVGSATALATRPPAPVVALLIAGSPVLGFLVVEQRLAVTSARWQERLRLELPVVGEQLAMLLGAGYSLSAALQRLATRGDGCVARDLRRVVNRIHQGVSESTALREWGDLAKVAGVSRLVSVLALNRSAADIGTLVAAEARNVRRDLHRDLVETMERRSQQVWIPVTVATLVPGSIFLAIPFIEALQLFSGA